MENALEQFKKECRNKGLRLTKQKLAIYEILLKDKSHPTAEDIHQKLKRHFPKASFATVYDNLRKFKKLELIKEFNCGENCKRYEANMQPHHHIINTKTRKITDVYLTSNKNIPLPKELSGKKIKEIKITYIV